MSVNPERRRLEWGLLVTGLLIVVAGALTYALESARAHRVAVAVPRDADVQALRKAGVDAQVDRGRRALSVPVAELGAADVILRRTERDRRRGQDALSRSLNTFLERTIGAGKAYVVSNVERNRDRQRTASVSYATRATPLRSGRESVVAEITDLETEQVLSRYDAERVGTAWARGKTVTRRIVASGGVERLNLSLVVAPGTSGREMRSLEKAVQAAAGFDRRRGDRISVQPMPIPVADGASRFAELDALTRALADATIRAAIDAARWASLGLAALVFLGAVRRRIREAPASTEHSVAITAIASPGE